MSGKKCFGRDEMSTKGRINQGNDNVGGGYLGNQTQKPSDRWMTCQVINCLYVRWDTGSG